MIDARHLTYTRINKKAQFIYCSTCSQGSNLFQFVQMFSENATGGKRGALFPKQKRIFKKVNSTKPSGGISLSALLPFTLSPMNNCLKWCAYVLKFFEGIGE